MKKNKVIGWVGLTLFLLLPFILAIYGRLTMGNQRYTIGVVTDIKAARAGYQPVYKFEFAGNSIKGGGVSNSMINSMKEGFEYVGKRYYVMFDEKHNSRSNILLDYPVPDSIKFAPSNGWDSIPGIGQLEKPFLWTSPSPPVKKK